MPSLRALLPTEKYTVLDFDSRGVPDGADHSWRQSESRYWLEEGTRTSADGKELIVCGFVKPADFNEITDESTPVVRIIVLDADGETIRKRLIGRYTKDGMFDETQKVIGKPINEFIESNVWYSTKMREESLADGLPVIDTSSFTPEQVASKVVDLINN